MTPVEIEIAAEVRANGPVGIDRFMALALGHPRHGYYMTRDPFGMAGDFITAPEIRQIFGELLGLLAAMTWQSLGEPSQVSLVELGPGRGTLMADALRAARALPGFTSCLDVHLVEMSPVLQRAYQPPRGPAPVFTRGPALPLPHRRRARAARHAHRARAAADGGERLQSYGPVVGPGLRPVAVHSVHRQELQARAELVGR